MFRSLSIIAGALLLSSTAHATNARVTALSNNAGFIDDTDFFLYPSALNDLPARASINYDAGAFDGGFTLDDGRMLWFQRHNPTGAETGFRAVYGQANGDTGYLIRAAHNPGDFSIGGAWSNGPGRGALQNMAVDGDLHLLNKLVGDGSDMKVAFNIGLRNRTLDSDRLTLWGANLAIDTSAETVNLGGGYTAGPRFAVADGRLALQVGPTIDLGLSIADGDQPQSIDLTVPVANFAGEYILRDWFRLRGSLIAGWQGATDTDDPLNNLTWSTGVGGALGVGFSHNDAQFDLSINPAWALNGPYLLSGSSSPMFGVLSARVNL